MSLRRLLHAFFCTILLAAFYTVPAYAYEPVLPEHTPPGERILDYHSEITVNPDSTMTVTEYVTVRAEGDSIRHGIYRDFPTIYEKKGGGRYVTGFDVRDVTVDGSPEEHFTDKVSNGVRLYIGKKDVDVPRGVHTYGITYGTDRQLGFFENHDELYWNVTGNGWKFPMDRVSATVHLPDGAEARELSAYTGRMGAKGEDYDARYDEDGNPEFVTTGTLGPYEGLTIVVTWQKGMVAEPATSMNLWYYLRDNGAVLANAFGLIAVFCYYLAVWFKVGRDPEKGHIMPLYEPPDGLSPASIRYIVKHGMDNTAFTSAIVNLAVKGRVRIVQSTGGALHLFRNKYDLVRVAEPPSGAPALSPGEKEVIGRIFGGRQRIELGKYEPSVSSAQVGLESKLRSEYSTAYYLENTKYMLPGAGISVLLVMLVNKLGGETSFLLTAPYVGINAAFFFLNKAPTVKGRRTMDRIEGFRMFLKATDEDRLNRMNRPEKTPELFEKYLPYAIAFGCENEWGEQFAGAVMQAAIAERTSAWYVSNEPFTGGNFTSPLSDSLSGAFSGAISSASTQPGSSSGGGGGGSSGGGGGGGGGGGW